MSMTRQELTVEVRRLKARCDELYEISEDNAGALVLMTVERDELKSQLHISNMSPRALRTNT